MQKWPVGFRRFLSVFVSFCQFFFHFSKKKIKKIKKIRWILQVFAGFFSIFYLQKATIPSDRWILPVFVVFFFCMTSCWISKKTHIYLQKLVQSGGDNRKTCIYRQKLTFVTKCPQKLTVRFIFELFFFFLANCVPNSTVCPWKPIKTDAVFCQFFFAVGFLWICWILWFFVGFCRFFL